MREWWIVGIAILVVVVIVFGSRKGNSNFDIVDMVKKVGSNEFGVSEETVGYENFTKLRPGGPGKDGIPAIDRPQFASGEWLDDEDVVFVLNSGGVTKVYPQRILNWHELVNDEIAGKPVTVSFCPLCGSAVTYERTVGDRVLDFGVSGMLFNSNLVMYDRQTDSLWQQIGGEAIVGEHFGMKLVAVPMDTMFWRQAREKWPNALVLTRSTGSIRDYSRNPYGDYEQNDDLYFPVESYDSRLSRKEIVFGFEIEGEAMALVESKLQQEFQLTVGDVVVSGSYVEGDLNLTNRNTGKEIAVERDFWFAWAAFFPKTKIYP